MKKLLLTIFLLLLTLEASATITTVRVLNAYRNSSAVNSWLASQGGIEAVANAENANLNSVMTTMGINVRFISAGTVSFPETLAYNTVDLVTNLQAYTPVLVAKDNLNADIVVGFTDFGDSNYGDAAGRAYMITATYPFGFAVVSNTILGPGEQGYGHEIGHLLGGKHQSTGGYAGIGNDPSIGQHGGYVFGVSIGFGPLCSGDIMAYPAQTWEGVTCPDLANYQTLPIYSSGTGMHTGQSSLGDAGFNGYTINYCCDVDQYESNVAANIDANYPSMATFRTHKLASSYGTISGTYVAPILPEYVRRAVYVLENYLGF